MTIRVLIADDHTVVRRGVRQILEDVPDIAAIDEVSSGRAVLQALRKKPYDVVLLDISMPEGGGLEILPDVKSVCADAHVLILTMYPEKQYARRALRTGADGYLTKESAAEELLTAIRTVARGEKYITTTLAQQLAAEVAGEREPLPHESLSNREYQVMRRLAAGQTVSEIADDLALSAKTISTYRSRLLDKLGLQTTAEVIRYAFEHDLAD